MKTVITGASGLIGGYLLKHLLSDEFYSEIIVLARKPLGFSHPRLKELILDFSGIHKIEKIDAAHFFCCLGTTIRKAGTRERFREVDFSYVAAFAKLAERSGARVFQVVSSIGADPLSRNFYLQVKGEMEESVRSASIPSIVIFRPSMLMGERKEFRFGEEAGKFLMKGLNLLLVGKWKKYRGIEGSAVSEAMFLLAKEGKNGIMILESDKIQELADKANS
jgi:uncharacterized protein YbjT (DUF2867 family)